MNTWNLIISILVNILICKIETSFNHHAIIDYTGTPNITVRNIQVSRMDSEGLVGNMSLTLNHAL
jgi:hypothetical protein